MVRTISKKKPSAPLIQTILLGILIILVCSSLYISNKMQGNARVVNYAGIVRGGTQRLVKKELAGDPDDELMQYLDTILDGLQDGGGEFNLVQLPDKPYHQKLADLCETWAAMKTEITLIRTSQSDGEALYQLSELHFAKADAMVGDAEHYSERIVIILHNLEVILIVTAVLLVGILLKQMFEYIRLKHINKDLNKMAFIDRQTGIANKCRCEQLIAEYEEIRSDDETCCIMFDLNNLKDVNDTSGHQAGDILIQDFAKTLRATAPADYFVGRYGGDEFIVIVHNKDETEIESFLQCLRTNIDNLDRQGADIMYAFGYATLSEFPGSSMQTLLNMADKKMYENKKQVKKCGK